MKARHYLVLALAASAACVQAQSTAEPTNLLVDGSFELANQAAGTWGFYKGSPATGWYAVGDNSLIELRNNLVGTAQNGSSFAELDSQNANSTMAQDFATVAGQTYYLSFYYSSRPASDVYNGPCCAVVPAESNGISFNVGAGWTAAPSLGANQVYDNVWNYFTTSFVAASSSTTLSFMATGLNDTYGTSLDNVKVWTDTPPVPEPTTLALMVAGLVAVGARVRRQQKSS
ncbi:MAG: PEP-CTERM sorting domain-containing protein [Ideonella sp.]|nr:PEP-CTERM sorting domain-containing protein [Ideonella sp.]